MGEARIDVVAFAFVGGTRRGGTTMVRALSTGHTALLVAYQTVLDCVIDAGAVYASLQVDTVGSDVTVLLAPVASHGHSKVHMYID